MSADRRSSRHAGRAWLLDHACELQRAITAHGDVSLADVLREVTARHPAAVVLTDALLDASLQQAWERGDVETVLWLLGVGAS